MLEFLRKQAQSPYIQAAILIIVIVFIFWGTNFGNGGGPSTIATVNGQSIPTQAFQKTYDQMVDKYRERFGGKLPPNLLKNLGLKDQVLEQLIEQELIRQGAHKMGLTVSNEEVRRSIQKMDVFRTSTGFDMKRYQRVLNANRLSVSDFEAGVRSDLLRQKVLTLLSGFVRVSPQELKERFAYDYGEINLQYAALHADAFAGKVKVAEKDLTAFFKKNQNNYRTEPQVKVKYVSFPYTEQSEQKVKEAAIEAYYQRNIDKYRTPEKRRARHILIKTSPSDSSEVLARKRQKIEKILARARKGEDFAKLAKEYSEDGSATNGGDLGFFSRGQMVTPFEKAAFSLAKGQISDIVKTRFGFHIIKLEDIRPAQTTPLAKVKKSIEAKLRQQEAKKLALQKANKAYEQIILSGSLEKYAKQHSIAIKETDYFSRQSPPAEFAENKAFLEAAFKLRTGELSSLLTGQNSCAIIFIEGMKKPEVPPLAQVRDKVQKDFIASQAERLARETAQNLLAEVKSGADLEAKAKGLDLKVKETGFFSRQQSTGADLPPQVLQEGLALSAAQPYPKEVVNSGSTFYVLRFKGSREPSKELFAAKKDELKKRLMQQDQMALLTSWLANLKTGAKITRNEQLLGRFGS
jgi:peptidyl-prolyl cis-trans isomerase D